MKKIVAIGAIAALAIAAGCSKKDTTASSGDQSRLVDVQPTLPVHQAVPPQAGHADGAMPIGYDPMAPADSVTTGGSMAPGQKYTVKRGDTLWSIAQRTYGNGNQYKKIAAANPGIKGDKVMAGQTITLP